MAKEWEKWIDKVCGKNLCKTKVYKFVKNLKQKYVDNFWQKRFVKNCVEKQLGSFWWGNWVKGVGKKSC